MATFLVSAETSDRNTTFQFTIRAHGFNSAMVKTDKILNLAIFREADIKFVGWRYFDQVVGQYDVFVPADIKPIVGFKGEAWVRKHDKDIVTGILFI